MSDEDVQQDLPSVAESLGQQLRTAREQKGLTTQEVAKQLMLGEPVVKGLEAGDYSLLPELPYVRGYLAAYLRLLKLPESSLGYFDQANDQQPSLRLSPSVATYPSCSRDGWARCVSAGLVVLLVIAIGVWVAEQTFHVLAPVGTPKAESKKSAEVQTEIIAQPELTSVAVNTDVEANQQTAPSAESNVNDAELASQSIEVDTLMMPTAPEVSANHLKLSFAGESWIRIVDATEKRLKAGTFYETDIIEVEGKLPYVIILGRASNVRMSLAGKELSLPGGAGEVVTVAVDASGIRLVNDSE